MHLHQIPVLFLLLFLSAACSAQTEQARDAGTIFVSGAGHIAIASDTADVRLGVETQAASAHTAMTQNGAQTNQVLAALADLGLSETDLSTQSITLNPRYNFTRDKQGEQQRELLGYTATNIIRVKVKNMEQVGPAIDAAIKAGANRIDNIQFSVDDPTAALNSAREAAWRDAHSQAQQLAALANATLGEVISIETTQNSRGPVQFMEARSLSADTPVMGGQQQVSVTLNVRWALN